MGSITRSFANNITTAGKFDGTKLTGDIPEANLSANAPAFDDNKIVNDLSTLGLRVHTQENLNASNTNSQYVDVFNDSSGYTNGANTTRSSDEYVSTIGDYDYTTYGNDLLSTGQGGSLAAPYTVLFSGTQWGSSGAQSGNSGGGDHTMMYDGLITDSSKVFLNANNGGDQRNSFLTFDFGSAKRISRLKLHQWDANSGPTNTGSIDSYTISVSNDNASFTTVHTVSGQSEIAVGTGETINFDSSDAINHRYLKILASNTSDNNPPGGASNSNAQHWGISEAYFYNATQAVNTTGNFLCPAITAASSTTKMGAVITYQDNAGTNALNTDIVLQLSADNGSNFSTATLTALPDFSSGIKMAKVNDLPVTAGTQLKYKISFANQAAGSKEARIRGVSLNY